MKIKHLMKTPSQKPTVKKALLFVMASIPMLFLAPITLNIGFSALKKDGIAVFLVIGSIFSVIAITLILKGIIILFKAL